MFQIFFVIQNLSAFNNCFILFYIEKSSAKGAAANFGCVVPSKCEQAQGIEDKSTEMATNTECVKSGHCAVITDCSQISATSGGRERRDTTVMSRLLLRMTGSVPNYDYFPNGTYNDSTGNAHYIKYTSIAMNTCHLAGLYVWQFSII